MLTFANSLTFSKNEEPDAQFRNFWSPEDEFVWSTGKWCEISFRFESQRGPAVGVCDLILDLDVFKKEDEFEGQNVLLYLNGIRIGSLYCARRATYVFPFDPTLLKAENNLTLDTPDSECPSKFDIPDTRQLGVQLFSIQIRSNG